MVGPASSRATRSASISSTSWSTSPCSPPAADALWGQLFAQLDGLLGADAVLATNTSALSITELATGTSRPSKVVGLHWFNPAPVMGLVEVVRTVVTDPAVLEDVQALVARVGKTAAVAADRAIGQMAEGGGLGAED